MKNPQHRALSGVTGGAVLVLITSALLVTVLVMVLGGGNNPVPQAGPRATKPALPIGEPTPQDWQPIPSTPDTLPAGILTTPTPAESVGGTAGVPLPSPRPVRSPADAYAFTSVAGAGCAETDRSGSIAAYPAGQPVPVLAGGWRGPGCAAGSFWAVPMSGEAGRDTPGLHVLWWFHTGALSSGTCAIWVYVPKSGSDGEAAGKPTHYGVLRGRDDEDVIGQFTVDQSASQGAWAHAGTFPLRQGSIAVKLVNRGVSSGGARHAAAQIQVGCRPESG